jgi:thiol-disulfide isomerase/thioredoxin
VHEINSKEKLNSLKKMFDIVIIKFYAQWCGPCKGQMKTDYITYASKNTYTNIIYTELDVGNDDLNNLDILNKVHNIPYLIILNKENILLEYSGTNGVKEMQKYLESDEFNTLLNKLEEKNGGANKYKKTDKQITVIYKKKEYTRVIYICERKKYVKINKTFMLLSKLKKV